MSSHEERLESAVLHTSHELFTKYEVGRGNTQWWWGKLNEPVGGKENRVCGVCNLHWGLDQWKPVVLFSCQGSSKEDNLCLYNIMGGSQQSCRQTYSKDWTTIASMACSTVKHIRQVLCSLWWWLYSLWFWHSLLVTLAVMRMVMRKKGQKLRFLCVQQLEVTTTVSVICVLLLL